MWQKLPIILTSLCLAIFGQAQSDTIFLKNGSFEDIPQHSQGVRGWVDCGFIGESKPDVQPFNSPTAEWGQLNPAHDGSTYLGMVVRDNDTYERVNQKLTEPLLAGQCYSFSIYLCSSDHYMSRSHKTAQLANYVKPAVLRIWGGNEYCDRGEMLGESATIGNKEWQRYDFEFHPKGNYSFIILEAFYKTPAFFVYNGNILLDGASPIIQIACPGEQPLVAVIDVTINGEEIRDVPPRRTNPPATKPTESPQKNTKPTEPEVAAASANTFLKPPKNKILKNLDRDKLAAGQTIRIENLYFQADSTDIDTSSFDVLDEIAYFLSENKDVVVEIGGHTNNRPVDSICDRLSTDRAKAVEVYLKSKGINPKQLESRGYGKRKPIMSNYTLVGRQRNQRVEIRILSIAG